jgi:predicted acyl esterase
MALPGPRIDYLAEVVRWLDHWCRDSDTGVLDEPPIVVYMQRYDPPDPDRLESSGAWRAERSWPPAGLEERVLLLGDDGRLEEAPGTAGVDALTYEPGVGMQGGLHSIGQLLSLPGDQRPDEAFSRVYTTAPLDEPLAVLGRARAELRVETSASVIGFAVSLCDVAPDGTSALVAKGMRNATRRASLSQPEPVEPGVPFDLSIEIDATGWIFEPGHRIRLAVANADFPNVWPTPETATSGIHRGGASSLVLPVVPLEGPLEPPAFAPSPVAVSRKSSLHPRPSFRAVRDALTGHARFELDYAQPRGDLSEAWHFSAAAEVDPRDPASASVRGTCRVERRYGALTANARSQVIVQGSASDFHVVIDVETLVNGHPHFARRWVETIPRRLL